MATRDFKTVYEEIQRRAKAARRLGCTASTAEERQYWIGKADAHGDVLYLLDRVDEPEGVVEAVEKANSKETEK